MSSGKVKTVDGAPTPLRSLNTGVESLAESKDTEMPVGLKSRLIAAYKNLNLVMAGMYTGVGCVGTPHAEHSYEDTAEDAEKE